MHYKSLAILNNFFIEKVGKRRGWVVIVVPFLALQGVVLDQLDLSNFKIQIMQNLITA